MTAQRLSHAATPGVAIRPQTRHRRRVPARLLAWWQSAELDRLLATGAAPARSPALAARARVITHRRSRLQIADGLARARRSARERTAGFSAAVKPHADEIIAARVVLGALDRRLRAAEPVTARGMAMLRRLLTDGASALYAPRARGALGSELRAIAAALEPERQAGP
jgi:hypothetical protein